MALPACIDDAAHHDSAAGHVQAASLGSGGGCGSDGRVGRVGRPARLSSVVDGIVQAVEVPALLREALPRSLQVLARGTNGLVVPAILRRPAKSGYRTLRMRNVSASAGTRGRPSTSPGPASVT